MNSYGFGEVSEIVDVVADDVSLNSSMYQREECQESSKFLLCDEGEDLKSVLSDSYTPVQKPANDFDEEFRGRSDSIRGAFNNFSNIISSGYNENSGLYKNYNSLSTFESNQMNSNKRIMGGVETEEKWSDYEGVGERRITSNQLESALTRELKSHLEEMEKKNLELIFQVERLKELNSSQTKKCSHNEVKLQESLRQRDNEVYNLKLKLEELINFCKQEKTIVCNLEKKTCELEKRKKVLKESLHDQQQTSKNEMFNLEKRLQEENSKTKDFYEKIQLIANNEIRIDKLSNENQILQDKNTHILKRFEENFTKFESLKTEKTELENKHKRLLLEMNENTNSSAQKHEVLYEQYNETLGENTKVKNMLRKSLKEHEELQSKLDTLLMAEKKLMDSIDDVRFKESVSREECTNMRIQVNSLKNECLKHEKEINQITIERDQLKRQHVGLQSEKESLTNILHVFETKTKKMESEKVELIEKLSTSSIVTKSLKKEVSKLSGDLSSMKAVYKETEKNIKKIKEMQLSKENEILDLQAMLEVGNNEVNFVTPHKSLLKLNFLEGGKLTSGSEYEKMSREGLVKRMQEAEVVRSRNESHINHLISLLSCHRNELQNSFHFKNYPEIFPLKQVIRVSEVSVKDFVEILY